MADGHAATFSIHGESSDTGYKKYRHIEAMISERGAAWDRWLFRLLQSSAAAPVTRLSDAGGNLFSNSGGSSKTDGRNQINTGS
jgi:hypothetical protein